MTRMILAAVILAALASPAVAACPSGHHPNKAGVCVPVPMFEPRITAVCRDGFVTAARYYNVACAGHGGVKRHVKPARRAG